MRNGCSLNLAKVNFALLAATVNALPPLSAICSKRDVANASLALLKTKDNSVADGKS